MKRTVFSILFLLSLVNVIHADCLDCSPPSDNSVPLGGAHNAAGLSGGVEGTLGSVVNVPASNLPDIVPAGITNILEQMIPLL